MPIDPVGLHRMRILGGLLCLAWLLPFAGHVEALFGLQGWFDVHAYKEVSQLPQTPFAPTTWSIFYLAGSNALLLQVLYWGGMGCLLLYTLGVATRLTSVFSWVFVASFMVNPLISYGADYLVGTLLFYLMVGYVLYGLWCGPHSTLLMSLGPRDTWVLGSWPFWGHLNQEARHRRSHAANLAIRLVQIHFAIVIVVSGLHKLQFGDWWGGVALWYPLHPPFETTLESVQKLAPEAPTYLFFLSLVQYLMLGWQLGFPLFAWRANWWWRVVLIGGGLVGWLGSIFVYQLPLFGPVYFVACLSYLTPEEWHGISNGIKRLVLWLWPGKKLSKATQEPTVVASKV